MRHVAIPVVCALLLAGVAGCASSRCTSQNGATADYYVRTLRLLKQNPKVEEYLSNYQRRYGEPSQQFVVIDSLHSMGYSYFLDSICRRAYGAHACFFSDAGDPYNAVGDTLERIDAAKKRRFEKTEECSTIALRQIRQLGENGGANSSRVKVLMGRIYEARGRHAPLLPGNAYLAGELYYDIPLVVNETRLLFLIEFSANGEVNHMYTLKQNSL